MIDSHFEMLRGGHAVLVPPTMQRVALNKAFVLTTAFRNFSVCTHYTPRINLVNINKVTMLLHTQLPIISSELHLQVMIT